MSIKSNIDYLAALQKNKIILERLIYNERVQNDRQIFEYSLQNNAEKANMDIAGLALQNQRVIQSMVNNVLIIKQNIKIMENIIKNAG